MRSESQTREQFLAALLAALAILAPVTVGVTFTADLAVAGHSVAEPNDDYTEAETIHGDYSQGTEVGDASNVGKHSSKDADGDGVEDFQDDQDWFRFYVDADEISGDVTVSITHDESTDGDLELAVYSAVSQTDGSDDDGEPESATVVGRSTTDTDNESVTISNGNLVDDTYYYVRVYADDNADAPCSGGATCDGTYVPLSLTNIPSNYGPSADATKGDDTFDGDTSIVEGGTSLSFDGTDSSDPEGDSLTYTWTFGDGTTNSGSTTTYDYGSAVSTNGGKTTFTPDLDVDDGTVTDTDSDFASITVYNDYDGDGKADDDSATGVTTDGDDDDDGVSDGTDPSQYDADTDGDGLNDDTEMTDTAGNCCSLVDTDGDGTDDVSDTDSDDDGVSDGTEGTSDADGDGFDDFRDNAPVFTSGADLSSIQEDPSSNSGTTVDSLLSGNFDDSGGGTHGFAGVLITGGASDDEGDWQYSTDGGSSWSDVGSVSASDALFVASGDRIRFSPASEYSGDPGDLSVYAVDDSESFSTGDTADTTTLGAVSGVADSSVAVGISVSAVDDPPTATLSGGDRTVERATSVEFDATGSSDAEGSLSYGWTFGDGDTGGGATATHTYSTIGEYTLTMTVTDQADQTDAKSITVTVEDTRTPSIANYQVTNPTGNTVRVAFSTNEPLDQIEADLISTQGKGSYAITVDDFTEHKRNSATYDYTATVNVTDNSPYDASLSVSDPAYNQASESTQVTVGDVTRPTVSNFGASATDGNLSVSFTSNEHLESIEVAIDGPETATLTDDAFSASNGTYTATYEANATGTYTATIVSATDDAGNEGASGQDDTATIQADDGSDGGDGSDGSDGDGSDVDEDGRRSTDVDGDGINEDVEGDGTFGTGDVQALLGDIFGDRDVDDDVALYDVNGDGKVGTGDVQALLDELFS